MHHPSLRDERDDVRDRTPDGRLNCERLEDRVTTGSLLDVLIRPLWAAGAAGNGDPLPLDGVIGNRPSRVRPTLVDVLPA